MSHGVEKETFVGADEKTTKALTYDLLDRLYNMAEKATNIHQEHLAACSKRFKTLEIRKKKDTAISSASGVLGGFIAVIILQIRKWLN